MLGTPATACAVAGRGAVGTEVVVGAWSGETRVKIFSFACGRSGRAAVDGDRILLTYDDTFAAVVDYLLSTTATNRLS
jgi:hypothetical protein